MMCDKIVPVIINRGGDVTDRPIFVIAPQHSASIVLGQLEHRVVDACRDLLPHEHVGWIRRRRTRRVHRDLRGRAFAASAPRFDLQRVRTAVAHRLVLRKLDFFARITNTACVTSFAV